MKKTMLALSISVLISFAGFTLAAYADEGQPLQPPAADAGSSSSAVVTPPADTSQCAMKTDLSPDMVTKCTEAMASGDPAMLAGCCQEGATAESDNK